MKSKLILFVFLCCISSNLQAQDTLTYYCNANAQKTAKDSASFLRKSFFLNGHWNVLDYYLDDHIKCTGTYDGKNEKQGHFVYYYESGNKYREGNYYRNLQVGTWKMWYDNAVLKSNENYSSDTALIDRIMKDGITSLKLFPYDVCIYIANAKGIFKDTSSWYYPDGKISDQEVWNNKLIDVKLWTEDGSRLLVSPKMNEANWKIWIQRGPVFKGDLDKLIKMYGLRYSKRDAIFDPMWNFTFVVKENGEIGNISYYRNPNSKNVDSATFEKYKQLIRSTKGMWEWGTLHNLPVDYDAGFRGLGGIGSFDGWQAVGLKAKMDL